MEQDPKRQLRAVFFVAAAAALGAGSIVAGRALASSAPPVVGIVLAIALLVAAATSLEPARSLIARMRSGRPRPGRVTALRPTNIAEPVAVLEPEDQPQA